MQYSYLRKIADNGASSQHPEIIITPRRRHNGNVPRSYYFGKDRQIAIYATVNAFILKHTHIGPSTNNVQYNTITDVQTQDT